jgi:hypothetical protein
MTAVVIEIVLDLLVVPQDERDERKRVIQRLSEDIERDVMGIGEVVGYDHPSLENRLVLHLGADDPDRVIAIALPLARAALRPLPGSYYSVEGGGQSIRGLPISQ